MILKFYQILTISIVFSFLSFVNIHSVEAQTNSTTKIFKDPTTGISLQYPSDWHVASKEYVDSVFGVASKEYVNSVIEKSNFTAVIPPKGNSLDKIVNPIVMLLPESLSGSTLFILSEKLPFQVSVEKYFELTKRNILLDQTVQISDPVPISISGWNGLKYNVTHVTDTDTDSPYSQTQILFVKDSTGYVIASQIGSIDQIKENKDLHFILDSMKFENTL